MFMKIKSAPLAILVLLLLINGCLFATVNSQETAKTLTVTLGSPSDGATLTTWGCNFTYTPVIIDDAFVDAKLYINGTQAATNQSPIENATSNRIPYTFTANGTYLWEIKVQNSSHTISPSANFTINVIVPPEPTPTPAPTTTPTPTPTPTPTVTPTATPSPTPTPTPTPTPAEQTLVIDGSMVLVIGLIILAIILTGVILFLRNAAR
jgi:hypothetical protein